MLMEQGFCVCPFKVPPLTKSWLIRRRHDALFIFLYWFMCQFYKSIHNYCIYYIFIDVKLMSTTGNYCLMEQSYFLFPEIYWYYYNSLCINESESKHIIAFNFNPSWNNTFLISTVLHFQTNYCLNVCLTELAF